ncbi:MAG: hypothetical protein LBK99_13735 [Opitutaceae bacterium]|jgi:uncharacterized protein (TIGR03067 family)|nr:hypothetical protein [Opitutaceae bacterium]
MIDGIWEPRGAEFGGQAVPPPGLLMTIEADRYTITREGGERDAGRIEISGDSSAGWHEIDIVCEQGIGAGRRLRAIMRRRGNLLQLCYHAEENGERPQAFVSRRGSLAVLVRYRRSGDG